jgi:hypothetical protein
MNPNSAFKFTPAVLLAVWAVSASLRASPVVPLSQQRFVLADAFALAGDVPGADNGFQDAADFGPFNAAVDAIAGPEIGSVSAITQSVAQQDSAIGAASIAAAGAADVWVNLSAPSANTLNQVDSEARSYFDLSFTVDTASSYSLVGVVDTAAVITGGGPIPALANTVQFLDLDGSSTLFETLTYDEVFSIAGTLQPGTYGILASSSVLAEVFGQLGSTITVDGHSSFAFQLELTPSPVPEAGPGVASVAALLGACSWAARRRDNRPAA